MKAVLKIRRAWCPLFYRAGLALALVGLWVGVVSGQDDAVEDDDVNETQVRAVEARAKAAEHRLADERLANRRLARRTEALALTADLVSGIRKTPPVKTIEERPVLRLCAEPMTLDNRETGEKLVFQKWVRLLDNRTYRVRAKIEIQEITGTDNFKFGMMVTRPGKDAFWPAAAIGGSPFAEKEICFDYFCPVGGGNLFLVGFETGKGLAIVKDVRICEMKEVFE